MKLLYSALLLLLSLAAPVQLHAQSELDRLFGNQPEFLEVDEAFQLQSEILDNEILVRFAIADDYYLYRVRLDFRSSNATLGEPRIPEGVEKTDEYLGTTQVFFNHLEVAIPFQSQAETIELEVDYQGCAEAGLCYPPETRLLKLRNVGKDVAGNASLATPKASAAQPITSTNTAADDDFISPEQSLAKFIHESSLLAIVFYFLLLGIGLTFTPCVFPMIPILSGIIAGQGRHVTTKKAFTLSLTYTQAMAITYAILGVIVASLGSALAGFFQTPGFAIGSALIFVLLALSMFGFYELRLPSGLQSRLVNASAQQKGGTIVGVAAMGVLSSLIVSPCITAPLMGALIFISQSNDLVIGGLTLYALGLGMGVPLLLIGTGAGKLLPKAGPWMDGVKAVFGVLLLMVALYLVKHLLPGPLYLFLWAVLLIISGLFLGVLNNNITQGWPMFRRAVGFVSLLYGLVLMIGAAMGNGDLLKPLHNLRAATVSSDQLPNEPVAAAKTSGVQSHALFTQVETLADVQQAIATANAQGKFVMLDFFADWCVACYELADYTFADARVKEKLKNTLLLQVDVTENDAIDRELLKHYRILGLPAVLFFNTEGKELTKFRVSGFEPADKFLARLEAVQQ